jgi:putative NADPH-quinone reductase
MSTRILIIQGHPDPQPHLCHALVEAYRKGAEQAGHDVRTLVVTELDFPILRSRADWEQEPVAAIRRAQQDMEWAQHLVFVYPLWLGSMPALLKAFLEQVARPAFVSFTGGSKAGALRGKSARIIITMGMPGFVYRWYFGAHSLKSFKRNILGFVGVKPIRETFLGLVEAGGEKKKAKWLEQMAALGKRAV